MASIDISSGSDDEESPNSQKRLRTGAFPDNVPHDDSGTLSEEELFSSESEKSQNNEIYIEEIRFLKSEDYAFVPKKVDGTLLKFHLLSPFSFSIGPGMKYTVDLMFSVQYQAMITTYIFQISSYMPLKTEKRVSAEYLILDSTYLEDWNIVLVNDSDEVRHIERGDVIANLYLLNITIDRRVRLKFVQLMKAQE